YLGAILHVLGPLGHKTARHFFTAAKSERHLTEVASLHGKRLAVGVETGAGARLDEVRIKELTGNERVTARRMAEDEWTFNPTHKLVLCTNHKPEVRGTDHAVWRRMLLVPFVVTVADDKQDRDLPEKLQGEAAGILSWIVDGCRAWQKVGL